MLTRTNTNNSMTYSQSITESREKSGPYSVQYCKDNNLVVVVETVARDCTCGSGLPWNVCNGLGMGWDYCG